MVNAPKVPSFNVAWLFRVRNPTLGGSVLGVCTRTSACQRRVAAEAVQGQAERKTPLPKVC